MAAQEKPKSTLAAFLVIMAALVVGVVYLDRRFGKG